MRDEILQTSEGKYKDILVPNSHWFQWCLVLFGSGPKSFHSEALREGWYEVYFREFAVLVCTLCAYLNT